MLLICKRSHGSNLSPQINIHTDTLNESGFVESASLILIPEILLIKSLDKAPSKLSAVVQYIRTIRRAQVYKLLANKSTS